MPKYFVNHELKIKRCPKCEIWKPLSSFYKHIRNASGISHHCKDCVKESRRTPEEHERKRIWRESNREHSREYSRKRDKRIRELFLKMYGGKCECCGEIEPIFLALDHIGGQKGVKKKEENTTAIANATNKYQPDKYRILCHNCNFAVIRGVCPHQRKKDE